nr:uncharacterized protein LOC123744894 isoform X2 [Procambarus clarkii]
MLNDMAYQTVKTSREDYLGRLKRFIQSSSDVVKKFSLEMGWRSSLDRAMSQPEESSSFNCTRRRWSSGKGMNTQMHNEYSAEPFLPSDFVSSASNIVTIGYEDTRQPPSSAGELMVNFSREERLAMYEYSLQNASSVAVPPEILPLETLAPVDNQPKGLSELELKQALRDFKRRRQAYRTKVSTKNKSQTQVTREIIHNMMVILGAEELDTETPKYSVASVNLLEHNCSQKNIEVKNNFAAESKFMPRDKNETNNIRSSAEKDTKSNRPNELKFGWRDHENHKCRSKRWKHEKHYDILCNSHLKNHFTCEKEYEKESQKWSKNERSRKHEAMFNKDNCTDKKYLPRGKKYKIGVGKCEKAYKAVACRYNDNEKNEKYSDKHSYERFENEINIHSAEHDASVKAFDKLHDCKFKIRKDRSFKKDTTKMIKNSLGEEFEDIVKVEYNKDGKISTLESNSNYSQKDDIARSSKQHKDKRHKRKKEKSKHTHTKKRKLSLSDSNECN